MLFLQKWSNANDLKSILRVFLAFLAGIWYRVRENPHGGIVSCRRHKIKAFEEKRE